MPTPSKSCKILRGILEELGWLALRAGSYSMQKANANFTFMSLINQRRFAQVQKSSTFCQSAAWISSFDVTCHTAFTFARSTTQPSAWSPCILESLLPKWHDRKVLSRDTADLPDRCKQHPRGSAMLNQAQCCPPYPASHWVITILLVLVRTHKETRLRR